MSRFGYRSNGTRSRGDVLPENDGNLRSRDVELRFFAGLAVEETAHTLHARIAARGDAGAQEQIRGRVAAITDRFPVPGLPATRAAADVPA